MSQSPNTTESIDTPATTSLGEVVKPPRDSFWHPGFDLIPFYMLGILQICDWHSTLRAIGHGRRELNPFILSCEPYIGLIAAVSLFKLMGLAITAGYATFCRESRHRKRLKIPLYLLILIYGMTVINNYS